MTNFEKYVHYKGYVKHLANEANVDMDNFKHSDIDKLFWLAKLEIIAIEDKLQEPVVDGDHIILKLWNLDGAIDNILKALNSLNLNIIQRNQRDQINRWIKLNELVNG